MGSPALIGARLGGTGGEGATWKAFSPIELPLFSLCSVGANALSPFASLVRLAIPPLSKLHPSSAPTKAYFVPTPGAEHLKLLSYTTH